MTSSNIEFKAMPGQVNVDEAQGIVECFVAGIGNKDSVGDVLIAGAFTKSLTRRKPRVVWGHNWNDPIGKVLEIYEVAPGDRRLPLKMLNAGIGGLYARVQFNLNSEKGKEAFANIAFFGQEQEWSIGYKTLDAIFDPNLQANILKEVELYEVSPVLHGANQLTGTISVKSDDAIALAESEKGYGMMGPHHMMGQMPQRPTMIMVQDNNDEYESEKPIFSEGLAQSIDGDKKQRLEKEIMERTGSPVRLMSATESTAIFQRMMPNGAPMNFRIGYHTPDNYSTFMFGKPELIKNTDNASGSRVITPSQMPVMQIQVKPGYEQNYEKSDIASQLLDLEEILMSEVDEKVGKTINKRNLSKLKQIIENLQEVISSAEKEDLETKGYLIPVELHEAFHTKSLLDPILDYHRVESQVTEKGILITSGVTKDLIDAIDNAQKGIGRSISGNPGKGRAAGRAAFSRFDPKAWDGDGDGLVQEGTPFQRPAIPGVNDRSTRGRVNIQAATQAFTQQGGFASTSGGGNDFNRQIKPEQRVIDSAVKMLEKNREYIADRMMPGRNREILDENWVDETIKNLKKGEISHLDAMNIMNIVADIVSRKINEDPSLRDATSGEVFQYQKLSKRLRRAMVAGVSPEDMDNIRRGQGITRSQISNPRAFGSASNPPAQNIASVVKIDIPQIDDAIEELAAKDIGMSLKRFRELRDEGSLPERYQKAFSDRVKVLNDIFSGLNKEKLDESPGKVLSEIRKKLVDTLSSDDKEGDGFISGFNDRREIQNFIDGIEEVLNLAFDDYVDRARENGTGEEADDLQAELLSDFADSLKKISEKSKNLFDARTKSFRGTQPAKAKAESQFEKERLFDLLKNPLDMESLARYLDSTDGVIPTDAFLDRIRKGDIGDQDLVELNSLLEDALENIITLDPSLDPEKLAKEFSDAIREGAKNDESGVIQRIAKELGDDGVSQDLVEYLKDGREGSPFLPDRGKKEREVLRGFASESPRDAPAWERRGTPQGAPKSPYKYEWGGREFDGPPLLPRLGLEDLDYTNTPAESVSVTLTEKGRKKVLDHLVSNGINEDEANSILDLWEQNDGTAEEYLQKYGKYPFPTIKDFADAASSMYEDEMSSAGERGAEKRYYRNENGGRPFASSSRGKKIGRKKQTLEGTLTPQKNLSITLDDDLIGLLNEEVGMLLDNTKNREPLLAMKKILEDSKGAKFEVTPKQFDDITAAIEDAFENGVVTSDVYGVLHQAAESLDGKYDLNEINNPNKVKGFASSRRRINNGAPTDMTELQQRQYVAWARQQRGLRVAQEIIQEHDKNSGQMPPARWKALRTMYSNMASQGPRRSPGFASRDRTSKPTAGIRDIGTPNTGPLPYVYRTTGWKKVGGAGGLNDAGKYTDPATGKTYYVKHSASGEEFRGESEILTSKLYQLLGIGTINYERGVHNGKLQRVSEWNPGIKTVSHSAKSKDPKFKASVQKSLIANAWLANWDGTGNMSNIVEGPNGEAIMADSGGGLIFRAQSYSGMKGQGGTDSFGAKVEEVFNLINGKTRSGQSVQGGVSNAYYKDIEPSEVARQVKELSQVTDDDIKKLVSQQVSNKADGDRLAEILIARRDWIVDHWSTGQLVENPQDTSRSDASGSRVRVFASSSAGSKRGFASASVDGPGDDGPGSGRVIRARGLGEAVPGGSIEGRERASETGISRGDNTGLETRFAGKSFDETKPDNWDELTLDEKWNWALTEGNPENNKTEERMSPVAYKKLLTDLGEEADKEELARMSPAQRREERRIRKEQDAKIEEMGDPESKEEVKRRTEQSKPKEPKKPAVTKIKKSENAQKAKEERTKRLDAFIDFINDKKSEIETDEYEVDDHRELWDKVSTALQEGGYDFTVKSLENAIAVLDDYVGSFEDEQLAPGEKKNLTAAKKMLRTLISAKTAYQSDEWINGGKGSGSKPTAFASSGRQLPGMPPISKEAIEARKQMEKLISDTKKDIKKMQGTGKPGSRGFASTSSSGKTMITDEATFFQDIESSLVKEIRKARKAQDARAVKGLTKLEEIIRRDEASKTGSRRTNVGSIYFTMEEADQILDGLMFALDSQLEDGGEKRIAWYSKLIELIAKSAKSTFIDKTTSEIGKTTRTGTNSRGQTRTIKTIPDA